MPRHATSSNAGFSLLYVIAVIAALSTLAASIASLTGTGFIAELNESFATRARYIALAGFNYARQFKEDYDELENKTFKLGEDRFTFSEYRQFQDATGIMRIEFKVTGTAAAGTPQEANYVIYDNFESQDQGAVTFGDDMPHFTPNVSDPTKYPIVKNESAKTFTIGNNINNAFGSFYYTGTKTLNWGHNNCTAGICDFQEGVRLFFVSYYETNDADGIVFTILNSNNNTIYSIGGDSDHGEMIGYAGDSRVYSSGSTISKFVEPNQWGIRPPKIGIEFDNFTNANTSTICNSTGPATNPQTGRRSDIDANHIAYVFWGGDNDANVRFTSGFECAYCGTNPTALGSMSNKGNVFNYLWPTLNPLDASSSAKLDSGSAYVGVNFPAGKVITGFRAYGASDAGFAQTAVKDKWGNVVSYSAYTGSVSLKLYGNNSSTFPSSATPLATVTVTNSVGVVATSGDISVGQTAISNTTSYQYYWLQVEGGDRRLISHVQFLETLNDIYANTIDYPNNTTQVPAYIPYTANSSKKSNWQGALAYDDNRHGKGKNAASNWSTSIPQRGFWKADGWNANEAFAYRGEIERSLTPVSGGTNDGKYAYRLISWFRRCGNNNCLQYINASGASTNETNRAYFSDTSRFLCAYAGSYTGESGSTMTDYSRCTVANPPILDQTIYLTPTEHSKFDEMIFGFTEATGGSTQKATYSYFTLQFMKQNDYISGTTTKRRVINRMIKCSNSTGGMVDCP